MPVVRRDRTDLTPPASSQASLLAATDLQSALSGTARFCALPLRLRPVDKAGLSALEPPTGGVMVAGVGPCQPRPRSRRCCSRPDDSDSGQVSHNAALFHDPPITCITPGLPRVIREPVSTTYAIVYAQSPGRLRSIPTGGAREPVPTSGRSLRDQELLGRRHAAVPILGGLASYQVSPDVGAQGPPKNRDRTSVGRVLRAPIRGLVTRTVDRGHHWMAKRGAARRISGAPRRPTC